MQAVIDWFDDARSYGFATTTDGQRLFVHKRNFSGKYSSIVHGTVIEYELKNEPADAFEEALNSGRLRDVVINHRNPKLASYKTAKSKSPAALNIRVIQMEQETLK